MSAADILYNIVYYSMGFTDIYNSQSVAYYWNGSADVACDAKDFFFDTSTRTIIAMCGITPSTNVTVAGFDFDVYTAGSVIRWISIRFSPSFTATAGNNWTFYVYTQIPTTVTGPLIP